MLLLTNSLQGFSPFQDFFTEYSPDNNMPGEETE